MVEIVGQTLPKFGEARNYLTFNSKYIFTDLEVVELTKRTKICFKFYCDSGKSLCREEKENLYVANSTVNEAVVPKSPPLCVHNVLLHSSL